MKDSDFATIAEILKTNYDSQFTPYRRDPKRNAYFMVKKPPQHKPAMPQQNPMSALRYHVEKVLWIIEDMEKAKK